MATISVTPEAREAIARVVEEHGPIMFHTSGGRVGGRSLPICLPLNALRLGARDHLIGEAHGAPVYEMEDTEGSTRCGYSAYVLDVTRGPALGFSLAAAPGMRFTLRPDVPGVNEPSDRRGALL
jgi:uncharacterized protein (DUF779 family)